MSICTDLRRANLIRQAEWDKDDKITLSYRGNELAGEVGEACNVIKKLDRERMGIRGSRDTIEHLAEELADVVICADLIAMHEGIDLLGAAVPAKFNATSEKVGLSTRYVPACAWQPIDSAPREPDAQFLVCGIDDDRGAFVVRAQILWSARRAETPSHLHLRYLTHWMPLPAPPQKPEAA